MSKEEALKILQLAINYNEDGSCKKGCWLLGTEDVEAVKIAIKVLSVAITKEGK